MKVQTKITLLLFLVVATFIAGLWGFHEYDQRKFARITKDREIERKQSFEAFLEKDGEPLEILARYDAYWDQMVKAIETNDQEWFKKNVNDISLIGYKAHAAWIFNPNAKLIYSRDASDGTPLPLRLPQEAFTKIFANGPLAHFFIKIAEDIYEVRAATVHGSLEEGHVSPQRGFFFVGRLWNNPALADKSLL
ncbi:MAG: CHASE4 domain-containing protein [Chthoniobacterales bacterium]